MSHHDEAPQLPEPGLLPVIYFLPNEGEQRLVDLACTAYELGASGVIITDRSEDNDPELLIDASWAVAAAANGWLGINFTDCSYGDAVTLANLSAAQGVWSYNAGMVGDPRLQDAAQRRDYLDGIAYDAHENDLLLFGGVAMHGEGFTANASTTFEIAEFVSPFVDVVTTGGAADWVAPDPPKVAALYNGSRPIPTAIAACVTPENLAELMHDVHYVIATGGLETSLFAGDLDSQKLADLVALWDRLYVPPVL